MLDLHHDDLRTSPWCSRTAEMLLEIRDQDAGRIICAGCLSPCSFAVASVVAQTRLQSGRPAARDTDRLRTFVLDASRS